MNLLELKERYSGGIFEICLGDQKISRVGENEFLTNAPYREDRHPSMSFNVEKGLYYDFALGEGGDVIDLYCQTFNKTTAEALKELNDIFGGI